MHGSWVIWLPAGLLTVGVGAFLSALEEILWLVPRARIKRWPIAIRRWMPDSTPGHPRDGLLDVLMTTAGLLRALGWWLLWMAAHNFAVAFAWPGWACIAALVGAAALLEVIPSVLAVRRPRAWERALWRTGALLMRLCGGIFRRALPMLIAVTTRLFPWSARLRPPLDVAEVETLVRLRGEQGELTLPEAEVLGEVLQISRQTVRQYMTPRVDMVFVGDEMSNTQVREFLRKKPFLHIPVIGETPDEVVGFLDVRVLGRLPEGMHFTEALLPPSFVPETMEASELLGSFLRRRQPLAMVLDEFGGVEGLITLEDFIEEILRDAAPRMEAGLYIEQTGEGRLLASGAARLEDLGEHLGFTPQMEGIETIGGYIVNALGKLPRQGASVRLGPWKVTVRSMAPRRVREVSLRRIRENPKKSARKGGPK